MLQKREWYKRVTTIPSTTTLRDMEGRQTDRVIHIVIDGVSHKFLDEVMPDSIKHLKKHGTWVDRCHTIWPSITGPAHTAMNSGTYAGTNGVTLPYVVNPEDGTIRQMNSLAESRAESIVEALFRQGLRSAGICGHMNRGMQYFVSEACIGHHAERVTDKAIKAIDDFDPDYLQIVYFAVDTVQHVYGVNTDDARESLLWVGEEISRLIEKEAGKRTTFVISADHGMVATTDSTNDLLAPLFKELGLTWHGYGRFALLWGDDPKSQLEKLEDGVSSDPKLSRVVQAVWSKDNELATLGARGESYGIGAILLQPSYSITSGSSGTYPGNHGGYTKDEILVPLIFSGAGVKENTKLDFAETVDIAPTICRLLGCEAPKDAEGRILDVFLETSDDLMAGESDSKRMETLGKLLG
ncbi:MAG: alkaline phosphatase family protein [Firmicutes bacterium]|nr:alkaline phosphatase family protein [Bacillota bacterium]